MMLRGTILNRSLAREIVIPLFALAAVTAVWAQEPPLPPDSLQRPGVLLNKMKLDAGMTVVDLGTGLGNMLAMLSRRVGPTGRVLAEDTEDQLLAAAKEMAVTQNLTNVTFIKGTDADPKLPEGQVDLVFAFDVYHHFANPEKILAAIYKSLRPEGRLAIVEYYKRESAMPDGKALTRIRLDLPEMIKELEANHFHLVEEKEYLKNSQYLLILEKS
jgi:ubiquinone/menaquinone biosynthesis C-methylase UbiE